jgi:hypothetical protein
VMLLRELRRVQWRLDESPGSQHDKEREHGVEYGCPCNSTGDYTAAPRQRFISGQRQLRKDLGVKVLGSQHSLADATRALEPAAGNNSVLHHKQRANCSGLEKSPHVQPTRDDLTNMP